MTNATPADKDSLPFHHTPGAGAWPVGTASASNFDWDPCTLRAVLSFKIGVFRGPASAETSNLASSTRVTPMSDDFNFFPPFPPPK